MCGLCNNQMETLVHILFDCHFSSTIWQVIIEKFQIIAFLKSIEDIFRMDSLGWHPKLQNIISVSLIHTVHQVWLATNETRFNNAKRIVHVTMGKLLSSIKISYSISKGRIANRRIEHEISDDLHIEKRF